MNDNERILLLKKLQYANTKSLRFLNAYEREYIKILISFKDTNEIIHSYEVHKNTMAQIAFNNLNN